MIALGARGTPTRVMQRLRSRRTVLGPVGATTAALGLLVVGAPAGAAPRPAAPAEPGAPASAEPGAPASAAPAPDAPADPPSPPSSPLDARPSSAAPGGAGPGLASDGPDRSRSSAFSLPTAERDDPYGPRPSGVPRLTRDQVLRYALHNPAVKAAEQKVEAMKAQLRKAQWLWLPTIETVSTLSPGANIECADINLQTTDAVGGPSGMEAFQLCAPVDGQDVDLNTVQGYFSQLARAGVRVSFDANAVFPIFTFGKIRNAKRLAKAGVALAELETVQTQQETVKLVLQAHTALLLARESKAILQDAWEVLGKARARVQTDLGGDDSWDADPDADTDRDPNDSLKIELAELDVEQLMREALRAEALALASLWDLAGSAAPRGFDVVEDRLEPFVLEGGLRSLPEYRKLAVRERPEAHMARAAVEARQAQEKLARAAFLPDLGLAVGVGVALSNAVDTEMNRLYYQDRFNYSRITAALALRWRWDFHNRAFDLQKARAELRAQEYQREAAELFLGQDVSTAYQDVVEADHRIALSQRATDLSWKLVVSLEQRDTVGAGDAEALIRALKDWYKRRFARAEAIHAHNEAVARLARATGSSLIAHSPQGARSPAKGGPAPKEP